MTTDAAASTFAQNLKATASLAGPAMVARALLPLMMTADLIALRTFSGSEIGGYGLGVAAPLFFQFLIIGAIQPVLLIGSQAMGANEHQLSGNVIRIALKGLLISGPGVILIAFALRGVWPAAGFEAELARVASSTALIFSFGVAPVVAFIIGAMFLEMVGRAHIGMLILMAAHPVNIILNEIFVSVSVDAMGLGGPGVAAATVVTRMAMALAVWTYILLQFDRAKMGLAGDIKNEAILVRRIWRVAGPTSTSYGIEHGLAMLMLFVAGGFGALAVSGFQIAINYASIVGMTAVGVGVAGAIRIGAAVGAHDRDGALRACLATFALGMTVMAPIAIVTFFGADFIAGAFAAAEPERTAAADSLRLISIFIVTNGVYMISVNANRAASNVKSTLAIVAFANLMVSLPIGIVLARQMGFGANGLILGMIAGSAIGGPLAIRNFMQETHIAVKRL